MSASGTFNIRVYGLLRNDRDEILVTDEYRSKLGMTKFPGGGLQFGEGTREALIREFMEEMSREITVVEHYYTTDFFQVSAFRPDDQVISIYYWVEMSDAHSIPAVAEVPDFSSLSADHQVFRWVSRSKLSETDFTFPIDRMIASRLEEGWNLPR
ncbi:MAG: NUDIX domain-containing protein [Flavobacteriales bacterium]|nr:NUDIX domain-containing protein [Flavobacteriales bacterium]